MTKQIKTWALLGGLVVVLAGAAALYRVLSAGTAREGQLPGPEQGSTAGVVQELPPDFTVTDSQGNPVKLSELRGKPVVLNFWASWCPPCKREMPEFDRVAAELEGQVVFMMVDVVDGGRETQKIGAAYVESQGFTFPVYYDLTGEAAYLYGISALPTTYFLDSEGYVVTAAKSMIDEETLRRGIAMVYAPDGVQ